MDRKRWELYAALGYRTPAVARLRRQPASVGRAPSLVGPGPADVPEGRDLDEVASAANPDPATRPGGRDLPPDATSPSPGPATEFGASGVTSASPAGAVAEPVPAAPGRPGPDPRATSALGAETEDLEPLDPEGVEALKARFLAEPDAVLRQARESLGAAVSEMDFVRALQEAEEALRDPEEALRRLRAPAHVARAAVTLPPDFRFPLMTHEIPIDPASTRFSPTADLRSWLLFCGKAWLRANRVGKAPFRWHDEPRHAASGFRYTLREPDPGRPVEVALFSDFGTGEYPARYVARQLTMRGERLDHAVHLGGVYYAGRQGEFDAFMAEPLEPLLPVTSVLTLNADAEMRSGGHAFFRYLDERRGASAARQRQEGSYFCLASERFQLIGLDTAYFEPGRHREPGLLAWLEQRLAEGRKRGAVNVLLSHAAPYALGARKPSELLEDLRELVVDREGVDLWAWGGTRYGALFDRTDALPFLGMSLGHGGLPCERVSLRAPSPAPVRFLDTEPRFPEWTGLREDLGANGYASLRLRDDGAVEVRLLDWMGGARHQVTLAREADKGPLRIHDAATKRSSDR